MATKTNQPDFPTIDIRIYLGMLFFRWQTIVVCFLYALLVGVLYIHFTPKKYRAYSTIRSYRDPNLKVTSAGDWWTHTQTHINMLNHLDLKNAAVKELFDRWGKKMGSRAAMRLHVSAHAPPGSDTVNLSVTCAEQDYARDYLEQIVKIHKGRWQKVQKDRIRASIGTIEREMANFEERIRSAQDDVIEYQRLNDMLRVQTRAGQEYAVLGSLMSQRHGLETTMMMMEIEFPKLRDADIGILDALATLEKRMEAASPFHTAKKQAPRPAAGQPAAAGVNGVLGGLPDDNPVTADLVGGVQAGTLPGGEQNSDLLNWWRYDMDDLHRLSMTKGGASPDAGAADWTQVRFDLAKYRRDEERLLKDLPEDNPRVRSVRARIKELENHLALVTEMALVRMKDKYEALKVMRDALEGAEYKWQARNLWTAKKFAELSRLHKKVGRLEGQYDMLAQRLHNIRIAGEVDAERFQPGQVGVSGKPVWPDAKKILFTSLVIGLGSGFGLALVSQLLDNKIQSIKDVEAELEIPFLGGVPFWVHSGLERAIRPIVTEEHSSGAVEAYRALRTGLISALNKLNEKVVLVTSADSREGKTLTSLNVAIMIAQMGKRVLLVDMDVRRGRLHRSLGVTREPGLSDVLQQEMKLKDVVCRTRIEHLDLIPSGGTIDNSPELLQAADLPSFFVDVQDDYEYILVDSSPVLRVTDTVIAATQGMGVVVYVARANKTPKPLIRYSLDILKDAHVIGMIMNSIEMHKISSLYYTYQYPNYAYYSNAYAYGYDHYYDGFDRGKKRRFRRRSGSPPEQIAKIGRWLRKTFLPME